MKGGFFMVADAHELPDQTLVSCKMSLGGGSDSHAR
jgi:hypothetical protein